MNELVHRVKQILSGKDSSTRVLFPAIVAVLIALGFYAYLGIFSRYTSDDYCLSAFYLQDMDFVSSMVDRYMTSSSRYTNILFIGFADKALGWYNPAILPALMLTLLVAGLYLFIDQIQGLVGARFSRGFSFYLAALLAYYSIVQAPDLYETLYWRAGMTSHFAPVALLPFLGAFVIKQIRMAGERAPSVWPYIACFVIPFVVGGFSEPPTTLMVSALVLAIFAVWWWVRAPARRSILLTLSWTLAGALASLIVLALAPANSLRLGDTESNLWVLAWDIFYAPIEFGIDSLQTIPLPILFSVVTVGLLFCLRHAGSDENLSKGRQPNIAFIIALIWLIGFLLIAASFAPSVYGQSFPAARARFTGVVLFTSMLMATGALMGILVARSGITLFRSPLFRAGAILLFAIISLYPLRTAWRVAADIPAYQQRAAAWDERDTMIRALKADGVQDLTIPFLRDDAVQDLGDRREFRLNRCASRLYGVDSILTLPMK